MSSCDVHRSHHTAPACDPDARKLANASDSCAKPLQADANFKSRTEPSNFSPTNSDLTNHRLPARQVGRTGWEGPIAFLLWGGGGTGQDRTDHDLKTSLLRWWRCGLCPLLCVALA
ncbi:hypothetical protein ACHAXN_012157 [Cyclotella atomus]